MGLFVGDNNVSKIFVGDTAVASVWVGDEKVRPIIKARIVDFLLIGGGGGGASYGGGGGGAGGFIECFDYEIEAGEYPITIGAGGRGIVGTCVCRENGGDSCFNDIIAYGGGGGGVCATYGPYISDPRSGGSGGGGGVDMGCGVYGCGCSGQGNNGGPSQYWRRASPYPSGSGGGGAGCPGCYGRGSAGAGGAGKCSCMSGECLWYSGGGGGVTYYAGCIGGNGGCGGGGNGGFNGASDCCRARTNATYYGGGGGAANIYGETSFTYGSGYQGVFILRYPTACGYDITGGTKYTCGDYTIHCFTSNGTLTVN